MLTRQVVVFLRIVLFARYNDKHLTRGCPVNVSILMFNTIICYNRYTIIDIVSLFCITVMFLTGEFDDLLKKAAELENMIKAKVDGFQLVSE